MPAWRIVLIVAVLALAGWATLRLIVAFLTLD